MVAERLLVVAVFVGKGRHQVGIGAGKAVADQNVSQKVATQKKIIQDSLAGANGREQVEGWMPGYLAFPFRVYTDQGGGRIEAAWQSVAAHIQGQ